MTDQVFSIYVILDRMAAGNLYLLLLSLTVLCMLLINLVDLPISVPRINAISGGVGILDMKFYYTADDAYRVLEAQQQGGRKAYLKFLILFDSIFPFLYAVTFSVILDKLFLKGFPGISWAHNLVIVPFFVALFDYLENVSIITMLLKYPKRIWSANIAGSFTACKWGLSWLGVSLILLGLLRIF